MYRRAVIGPLPCVPETRTETSARSYRATAGGRMETESPRGLNLHPAKQPRTTLFDCLPAGLPSVPT